MPQSTESISKEMASFEAAFELLNLVGFSTKKDAAGKYLSKETKIAWWAWQASSCTSYDENKHNEFIALFESEFKKTDFSKELAPETMFETISGKSGFGTKYMNASVLLAWRVWNAAESLRSAGWGTERWDRDD